ncbi:hypothetical protein MLD38_019275 [Melastoma candidum]|uniref:Uncharacterized protein n=1 Tax=Melastoma candidum TaxID=119954 RepID=A0ACB9QWP5_9MYRT|nr:hypothetical protein MLD38_019275 [Melastoma candidum]
MLTVPLESSLGNSCGRHSVVLDMADEAKKTAGRQKIPMEKIENGKDRLITFSKRRSGIYKKACELAELCHADSAIVIFSPTQKPFSFGSPTVDSTLNRFNGIEDPLRVNGADVPAQLQGPFSAEHDEAKSQVEALRAQQRVLKKVLARSQRERWWERSVPDLAHVQAQIRWYQDLRRSLDSNLRQRDDGASGQAGPSVQEDQ